MKREQTIKTDIRVVQMGRSMRAPNLEESRSWLTIGHFNWTYVQKMDCECGVDLQQLREKKMQEISSNYMIGHYLNLYLVKECDDDELLRLNQFWERRTAFMVITRVHKKIRSQTNFEKSISECLTVSSCSVEFHQYRTLDLCDAILVMKSDSLEAVLLLLGKLYANEWVGDIYTYCCINKEELSGKQVACASDSIPLVSTRLAVRDSKLCRDFLSELDKEAFGKTQVFFVTGTDDVNIILRDMSSQKVCKYFSFLYSEQSGLENAVEDVTTRLGINESDLDIRKNESKKYNKELIEELSTVKNTATRLIGNKENVEERHKIALELFSALYGMSKNCIFTPLCYILLGAVRSLIWKLQAEQYGTAPANIVEFRKVLDGVLFLMEHIIRMEGELVHHPETRPLVYDIPATVLEYDLAFADRCARYLQDRESQETNGDEKQYNFLLRPSQCDFISIHDRFNDRNDKTRLLCVDIPLKMIYNHKELTCSLVHEVAHHSGEITRCRKNRKAYMCVAAASLLANKVFPDTYPEDIDYFIKEIEATIPRNLSLYVDELSNELCKAIRTIFQNSITMEKYIWDHIGRVCGDSYSQINEYDMRCQEYYEMLYGNQVEEICVSMNHVQSLFSECYADLVMVDLLNLNPEEYITLFKDDYSRALKRGKEHRDSTLFCNLLERVSSVIRIKHPSWVNLPDKIELPFGEILELPRFVKEFLQEVTYEETDNQSSENLPCMEFYKHTSYHPFVTIQALGLYLDDCFAQMRELDEKYDKIKKDNVQTAFDLFARQKRLASDDFYKEIEEYEARVLPEEGCFPYDF